MKYLITCILIISIIIFIFWQGKSAGETKEAVKCQSVEIQIKDETITQSKAVFKRQVIARATPINDDLIWLQQNICPDCNN